MIYPLLLSFYLATGSRVVLLDPSERFFNKDDRSEKSVTQIADLVSRSFYLGAVDQYTDVSTLKLPLTTPTENIQITMFGVDPTKLTCLESEAVPLSIGEGAGFAASKLANLLYKEHPAAKVFSISANRKIAEVYNLQHRAVVSCIQDAETIEDILESNFWSATDLSNLDKENPKVSAFIKEMDLFLRAAEKFGSGSQEQPTFFYLTLDSFSSLPENIRDGPALQLLDRVLGKILQVLPKEGIAQLVFSETRNILTNLHVDRLTPRRRLASNSSSSSNVTYAELYETQIFYWFMVGAAFVIYFFVYCFAFMNYSNDQMLYTSFDASYKKDM